MYNQFSEHVLDVFLNITFYLYLCAQTVKLFTSLNLTNRSDAKVKTELRRQLLVGLQSALKVNNLQIFCGEI